ncbi:MAG: bifunctional glutamate N-acetyltransferase/amino-acid acetyltransferase ArgJ [Actinobacteria bacterium]|nr:bifunctional glutamate N-acetyltransferase/amino-acid acetyltransferase ArgJ [Actinomycetota bacterium]
MELDNKVNGEFELIHEGTITDVRNFFASSCHCGIRKFREDFCILFTPEQSTCSGTFTKNKFAAAPVVLDKEQLKKSRDIKAIIINSGISNACTGSQGIENSMLTVELASKYLNLNKENILVASTGRIGKQLPMEKIEKGIIICSRNLNKHNGHNAAKAILTIDRNPKEIAVKFKQDGAEVVIGGIGKGSVMIEPNMATTMSFIATDIKIPSELLDEALFECVDSTFNCISTDGCQSTNDMIIIIANGASGIEITGKDAKFENFKSVLYHVLKSLALKVVEDAEGATKIIEINVIRTKDKDEARKIGKLIANSILFKSAMFGEDLNWGRIAAAIGSVQNQIDQNNVDIYFEDFAVMEKGQAVQFDIENANKLMKNKHLKFTVDLNSGNSDAKIYTADISYDYIRINAEYKKQK